MARVPDEDELIEHWTLVGDELDLLTGRTGPSKLGLALWLKFFTVEGRFPAGRSELPDEAVGYIASQAKVPASDLGLFDWEGRRPNGTAGWCARSWDSGSARWPMPRSSPCGWPRRCLKCCQRLGYFARFDEVPASIASHLRQELALHGSVDPAN